MGMYVGSASNAFKCYSLHSAQVVGNEGVGLPFYALGDVSVRRSAMGRIIFEAAESRRVMRRCDNDAVCEAALASAIAGEYRVRHHRIRGVTLVSIDHHVDSGGYQ